MSTVPFELPNQVGESTPGDQIDQCLGEFYSNRGIPQDTFNRQIRERDITWLAYLYFSKFRDGLAIKSRPLKELTKGLRVNRSQLSRWQSTPPAKGLDPTGKKACFPCLPLFFYLLAYSDVGLGSLGFPGGSEALRNAFRNTVQDVLFTLEGHDGTFDEEQLLCVEMLCERPAFFHVPATRDQETARDCVIHEVLTELRIHFPQGKIVTRQMAAQVFETWFVPFVLVRAVVPLYPFDGGLNDEQNS